MTGSRIRRLLASLAALLLFGGIAAAQDAKPKVTVAIGGASCLCYLPTVLARELGEYDKAGVEVELVDFKGGSDALKAVIGGSADVVSGYYDHCVNLAARSQALPLGSIAPRGMVGNVPSFSRCKAIPSPSGWWTSIG